MPLENFLPTIDDRRFDDIMAEIRTRIARYTPEWTPVWTDVNDNDPGITMVQVFAWLSDMMLYRMSKVPMLNYIKFLQLLGIELNPAEPAQAEITFPVVDGFSDLYVIVPERTQVSATSSDDSAPLIFETQRSLYALAPGLKSLQAFDGYDYTDIHADNDESGQGFEPFGPLATSDSAFLLGFDYANEFPPQVELNLAVWVFHQGARPAPFNCDLPQTRAFPSAQIVWEYWKGSEWQALSLLKDETQAFTQTGHIYLKTPAKGQMQRASIGAVTDQRYWIRARLQSSAYERPPQLFAIRTNTVAATQTQTAQDEVLGGSDGSRNQVFQLANTPVVVDTLMLEVNEIGTIYDVWTRVDDFFRSSPSDRHYVLDRTSGEVRFGDGVNGSIPIGNVDNADANVVARLYRFGGGKSGNVSAGTLKTLLTSISGIDENGITNLQAAFGGRDEETLDQAKLRAPQSIKNKCRAVTDEDFESLAKEAANIARAKALPLYHPDFPGVKVPGVISVVVVPDSDDPAPMPSDGTLRTVCAYLNVRRLLTTEVYVIAPTYQKVEIRAQVIAEDNADLAAVKVGIENTLLTYFHPLKGGEDSQGWPFGGAMYYSRVYQRVFTVIGVQRIEQLVIVLDSVEAPECKDVSLPTGVLVYSTEHDIQVNYAFDE